MTAAGPDLASLHVEVESADDKLIEAIVSFLVSDAAKLVELPAESKKLDIAKVAEWVRSSGLALLESLQVSSEDEDLATSWANPSIKLQLLRGWLESAYPQYSTASAAPTAVAGSGEDAVLQTANEDGGNPDDDSDNEDDVVPQASMLVSARQLEFAVMTPRAPSGSVHPLASPAFAARALEARTPRAPGSNAHSRASQAQRSISDRMPGSVGGGGSAQDITSPDGSASRFMSEPGKRPVPVSPKLPTSSSNASRRARFSMGPTSPMKQPLLGTSASDSAVVGMSPIDIAPVPSVSPGAHGIQSGAAGGDIPLPSTTQAPLVDHDSLEDAPDEAGGAGGGSGHGAHANDAENRGAAMQRHARSRSAGSGLRERKNSLHSLRSYVMIDKDKGEPPSEREPPKPWNERLWLALWTCFPFPSWIRNYKLEYLRYDIIAGVSTGLNVVPKSMAMVVLAGLQPRFGLYCAMMPALLYTLFGTSPHLGYAPSALVSLLTGAITKGMCSKDDAKPDAWYGSCTFSEYEYIVRRLTFAQGSFLLILGLLRAGWLLRFFSRPLLTGFLGASALAMLMSQFKYVVFNDSVHIDDDPSLFKVVYKIGKNLSHVHWQTIVFSLVFMVIVVGLKKYKRTRHVYSLLTVVLSSVAALVLDKFASGHGLSLTGHVDAGLPHPNADFLTSKTDFSTASVRDWIAVSAALALVAFMESSSAAQIYALKFGYRIDINQELRAAGMTNIIASFFLVMPVLGSLSMTAMLTTFGARTGIACFTAGLTAAVMSYAASLFYYLPRSALSIIIMSAVWGLIDIPELKFLWRGHRRDLWVVLVLVFMTLYFGVDVGLEFAIILNVVSHVYRSGNTECYELGRVPGTTSYVSLRTPRPLYSFNHIVIFRFNGPIFFGNETKFKSKVFGYLQNQERISRGLILDFTAVNFLDATGVHALEDMLSVYTARGALIVFSNANKKVMQKVEASEILRKYDSRFFDTIQEALEALLRGDVVVSPIQLEQPTEKPSSWSCVSCWNSSCPGCCQISTKKITTELEDVAPDI